MDVLDVVTQEQLKETLKFKRYKQRIIEQDIATKEQQLKETETPHEHDYISALIEELQEDLTQAQREVHLTKAFQEQKAEREA